jgi:hypothetical protein
MNASKNPMRPRQAAAVARLEVSRQRLQGALHGAGQSSHALAMVGRLVQQHPLAAVALATAAGGLLARLRPWQWFTRTELWAALLPPLAAALASAPLGAWAVVLEPLLRQATAPPPSKNA